MLTCKFTTKCFVTKKYWQAFGNHDVLWETLLVVQNLCFEGILLSLQCSFEYVENSRSPIMASWKIQPQIYFCIIPTKK